MAKRALITGVTGQDGSYLAEFLLEKGYEVHGIKRRSSSFNTQRLDGIYEDPHMRYYQASALAPFAPAAEKLKGTNRLGYQGALTSLRAYWVTLNYRKTYGLHACNAVLTDDEPEQADPTFITRKITQAIARIALGLEESLNLGNLDETRNWGHAGDYVRLHWSLLQQDRPRDYVISTGARHSVRQFVLWAAKDAGMTLHFEGLGADEIGVVDEADPERAPAVSAGHVIVRVDWRHFRADDQDRHRRETALLGDLATLPVIGARELCAEMVAADLQSAREVLALEAQLIAPSAPLKPDSNDTTRPNQRRAS